MTDRDLYFPKSVQLAAQHSQRDTGISACVSLAQWALESAYGHAMSGKNNPFGIKAPSSVGATLRRTWEVIRGRRVTVDAYFRNFQTVDEAFAYHGRMLARPDGYYRKALPIRDDWRGYIKAIAPIYATDPAYAAKLIAIVERWRLFELNLKP